MKLVIATQKLQALRNLIPADQIALDKIMATLRSEDQKSAGIPLSMITPGLAQAIINQCGLSPRQSKMLALVTLRDNADLLNQIVGSPAELHAALSSLSSDGHYNVEMELNGRWYPVNLKSDLSKDMFERTALSCRASYAFADLSESKSSWATQSFFEDDDGAPLNLTVRDAIIELGFRPLTINIQEHLDRCERANKVAYEIGKMKGVTGSVLIKHSFDWWSRLETITYGNPIKPRSIVIEPELEASSRYYSRREEDLPKLPIVRCFSLDLKKYVYVDIDDLEQWYFDATAIDKLVLPAKINDVLKKVFTTDPSKIFGDILSYKHGGMIILANGSTGVGKTLTAEVFAEHTKKPLYVMEMGELGTDLAQVEQNLQKIFIRASRWNAVLLMDEADVFMSKRDNDLNRSAIVGVFLRLLDYYPGMLFLTSNRAEVIDSAFKSRITLQIDYPKLDSEAREKIWSMMLQLAKIRVTDGLDGIPMIEINGRQIRNMVRLIKAMHTENESGWTELTSTDVRQICQFACQC